MLDLEFQIVNYFKSDKFKYTTPYLSNKNISKNLNMRARKVKTIMYKSDKFERISPIIVGSAKHKNNLNIYKLK